MAKDDYFAMVYYILKYLYACLQQGIVPREEVLRFEDYPADIESSYAEYTLIKMQESGFIEGLAIIGVPVIGRGKVKTLKSLLGVQITPIGIEYLSENSMMAKACESLKMFKGMIPFI